VTIAAYLTPELHITSYRGSPIRFSITPTQDGDYITDLASYDQIQFDLWSGTREVPGEVALSLRYTGVAPLYITVTEPVVNQPAITIDVPGDVSGALDAGQYFAELWLTPAGDDPTFTGWATWDHQPTTYGL
jgi:hypothetical protein